MSKAIFRDMTLAGGLLCLCSLLAACSSVTGTYADATGSFGLDVQSGGKATMRFMGQSIPCTYTSTSKLLTLNCEGQTQGEAFTINSDGSLAPPPDSLLPVLKKTK
jgi:hypothetical protein